MPIVHEKSAEIITFIRSFKPPQRFYFKLPMRRIVTQDRTPSIVHRRSPLLIFNDHTPVSLQLRDSSVVSRRLPLAHVFESIHARICRLIHTLSKSTRCERANGTPQYHSPASSPLFRPRGLAPGACEYRNIYLQISPHNKAIIYLLPGI